MFLAIQMEHYMKRVSVAVTIAIAVCVSSCALDKRELIEPTPQEFCDSIQATYVDTAKTIIDTYCATPGCHGQGSGIGDFTSYEAMDTRGNILIESGIVTRINATDASVVMPPGNTLPQELKDILTCWAEADYPEQ